MNDLWFSLYTKKSYTGKEPVFHNISTYKGVDELEKNYDVVYKELLSYLKLYQMEPQFNVTMVEVQKSWKVRSLRVWGVEMYDIQKHFPETMGLLNAIPNTVNIGFNLLEPGAKIKPHCGDTNANYRCHLGLKIPVDPTQCVMKVNNEIQHWYAGKTLCFMDAFEHEAWNNSIEQRIILLFDILKPEFQKNKNSICATILTSFYLQQLGNIWPGLYKIDRKFFKPFLFPVVQFLKFAFPLRNKIKK